MRNDQGRDTDNEEFLPPVIFGRSTKPSSTWELGPELETTFVFPSVSHLTKRGGTLLRIPTSSVYRASHDPPPYP